MFSRHAFAIPGRTQVSALPDDEVRRLFLRERNVQGLSWIWMIFAAVQIAWSAMVFSQSPTPEHMLEANVRLLIAGVALLTSIAAFRRDSWARFAGMLLCLDMMTSPVFAIVGLCGLVVLVRARDHFGPGRYHTEELRFELAVRERDRR